MNQNDIKDLVGEMTDEKIEGLDRLPSWEELYGKSVAESLIKRFVTEGVITSESRSDIVINHPKVSCKMLFVFVTPGEAELLVGSHGKSLKLPTAWTYTGLGNNRVIVEFAVK